MDAMMGSALKMWKHLGSFPLEGMSGSGPYGAPGGKHWITAKDVIRFAYDKVERTPRPKEWDRMYDQDVKMLPRYGRNPDKTLWDHQVSALCECMPASNTFRSGIVDMDCGTGKSYVGVELIRRSRACAIVVTQHTFSVNQWIENLKEFGGITNVMTLQSARDTWKPMSTPFPDVLVVTYSALARAFVSMDSETRCSGSLQDFDHVILWMARVVPFGLLILDEVHVAAADHFSLACSLYAKVIVGLSGSLVREDDRLSLLETDVGPVLYRHRADRSVRYTVLKVALPRSVVDKLSLHKRRDKEEHALRTLNPMKMAALRRVVTDDRVRSNRIVVFCDSVEAAPYVELALHDVDERTCVGVMDGRTAQTVRNDLMDVFHKTARSILISTKVCDVAVDFPKDCVVVILHSSSGSRQQEVQRCGRGTRGEVTSSRVFHIVNSNTEEEGFLKRRIEHMKKLYSDFCLEEVVLHDESVVSHSDSIPLSSFCEASSRREASTASSQRRQIKKRLHKLNASLQKTWKKKTLLPDERN